MSGIQITIQGQTSRSLFTCVAAHMCELQSAALVASCDSALLLVDNDVSYYTVGTNRPDRNTILSVVIITLASPLFECDVL